MEHKYFKFLSILKTIIFVVRHSKIFGPKLSVFCIHLFQDNYELQFDEDRAVVAHELIDKYLTKRSTHFVDIINEDLITKCKNNLHTNSKDLFAECAQYVVLWFSFLIIPNNCFDIQISQRFSIERTVQ